MYSDKRLSVVVDEALALSSLPPRLASVLRKELIQHYDEKTLFVTGDYVAMSSFLYSRNDNQLYTIISLSFVDDDYVHFLIHAEDVAPRSPIKKVISGLKAEGILTGAALGEMVGHIQEMKRTLYEILNSSTRSTRRATGDGIKEVDLPSMEVMKVFYECGRKTAYQTLEDATEASEAQNLPYKCNHCGLYHQGKPPTGMTVPQFIMEGRYRTNWRRYHKI